jgi:DNA-binding transcriptional ArsR family regulator
MYPAADAILKSLADPTRRAIFDRLAHDGKQTVHALTSEAGVSQAAVSKHLEPSNWSVCCVIGGRDGTLTERSCKASRPLSTRWPDVAPLGRADSIASKTHLNRMDQ